MIFGFSSGLVVGGGLDAVGFGFWWFGLMVVGGFGLGGLGGWIWYDVDVGVW